MFGGFVQKDVIEDKTEYGEPGKHRLKRQRQAYEEAEREDRENDIPFNIVGFECTMRKPEEIRF